MTIYKDISSISNQYSSFFSILLLLNVFEARFRHFSAKKKESTRDERLCRSSSLIKYRIFVDKESYYSKNKRIREQEFSSPGIVNKKKTNLIN